MAPRSEPWWRGAVIYQIYPRSFQDSDGDGVGDLKGIAARLDHVASLGVDGVWLSPVFTSPMRDYGYDVSDYCAIDPLFGTLKDFDALVSRAHALGLKLIIDQVYSHTSDQHPWFAESRSSRDNAKADWYVWADAKPDGRPPSNWYAHFGGPSWTWDTRRRQYYLHNFLAQQPDLNFHAPAVQSAILDVARFWLDRGVDGFRLDVANLYAHDPSLADNPPSDRPNAVKPYDMQVHLHDHDRPEALAFAARLRAVVDETPGRMTVAELDGPDPIGLMAQYTRSPNVYHTAYSFLFLRPTFNAAMFRHGVERLLLEAPDAWPSWAFSNHDVMRVVSRWGPGKPQPAFAKLMLALLTSLRGTAFVYQGEELGLPQADVPFERLRDPDGIAFWPAHKGRDGCRTPMPWTAAEPQAGFTTAEPWLPVDPAHRAMAVDRQADDPDSMLIFARRWLSWRRGREVLRTGDIGFFDTPGEVLGFIRRSAADGATMEETSEASSPPSGEAMLLLFNLGDRPARVPLPLGGWSVSFDLGGLLENGEAVLPAAAGVCAIAHAATP